MKNTIYAVAIVALALLSGNNALAQLPSSGDWNEITITEDQTINLTGDVNLKGCITISNGASLKIVNNTGSNKNIFNKTDLSVKLAHIFLVQNNSTLEIDGGTNGITIGGGASYNMSNIEYDDAGCIKDIYSLGTAQRVMSDAALDNNGGTLKLNKVTIQNVCIEYDPENNQGSDGHSGTIRHRGDATTMISNCTIQMCNMWTGAGIFVRSKSNGSVTVENTTFQYCINAIPIHSTHGGTVRAWGDAAAHMNLVNVKVHHCYSQVDAAALYWPANGLNKDGRFATLTLDGCEFYKNKASTQNGGALDLCGTVQFLNHVTEVHDNIAGTYGGGISIRPYNSGSPAQDALNVVYDITDKLEVYDNVAQKGGGIAFYSQSEGSTLPSGTSFEINLNGSIVHGNHAVAVTSGNGGGIWLRNEYSGPDFSFTFNMNKGSVYENTARQDGGGVYLYGWKIVSSDKAGDIISLFENEAGQNGGGLFINEGSDYTMNNGRIINNSSSLDGGGVYMRNGNFTMNHGEISSNISGRQGGGLFMQKGNITLNNGNIMSNVSTNGGGGINKSDEGNITIYGGTISNNEAGTNGGGINNQGTGSIIIDGGTLSHNSATVSGGGIYNGNGNISVKGGEISYNTVGNNGGALYSSSGILTVEGGEVKWNEASNHGGGVFVLGGKVSFDDGKLTYNTAINGGGVFLASGASMTFNDGLIANNHAEKNGNVITTVFNAKSNVPKVNGCGGGVYLRSGTSESTTSLTITVKNGFGLYGNTADRAGDDIVAEGVNTSVTVPNVTAMDLKDFEGKDAQPNWYEDYVYIQDSDTHDSGYTSHGILSAVNANSGKRFRQMLMDGTGDFYNHLVSFSEPSRTFPTAAGNDGYVCLSLGYIVLSAIIRATGLNENENMYFTLEQLIKPTGSDEWTVKNTYPVLVTGTKSSSAQRVVRNLMPGEYRVKQFKTTAAGASPWAWAYELIDPSSGVIQKLVTEEDGENNLFPFTVQHVSGDGNVMHDEAIKVNSLME